MGLAFRVLLVAGLAAAVPAAVWVRDSVRTPQVVPALPPVAPVFTPIIAAVPGFTPTLTPAAVATTSCGGAAGCHGRPAGSAPESEFWRMSAAFYTAADPHTRAYDALRRPLARHIMSRLHPTMPPAEPPSALNDPRCVACHTDPATPTEGVQCGTCHGRETKRWAEFHTNLGPDRAAEYDRIGMTKLFDLGVRADTCLGCHVGAPAKDGFPLRDMNHDMIAAGHPRLNFDMAEYQRRERPHWVEKFRTAPDPKALAGPAREVQTWLVGRVAHAAAAAELLEDRARRSDPWPEFADFNCFACHHEFEPESWRQTAARTTRRPGSAPWQTIWPATRFDDFARLDSQASRDLHDLVAFLERSRVPHAGHAAKTAAACAADLKKLRDRLAAMPARDAARLAVELFRNVPEGRIDHVDWDEGAQLFHGLAAIDRARMAAAKQPATPGLWMLGDHLRFPRLPGGGRFDSPRGYDPRAGRSVLRECLKSVPARADAIQW